jgi:hypothetical protein
LQFFGTGQKQVQVDTAAIEVRAFDASKLNEYKADRQFQYDKMNEPAIGLWDRFWMWVWWKVDQVMSTKAGRNTVWSVLIVLGVAVLAFFVYKVMQMNKAGLFVRSAGSRLDFAVGEENIHQIAFDEAIANAINDRNFRLATRLLYLQSLKILSDKNEIEWRINKTNTDYVREVKEKPWQSLFRNLTFQFEYVWYGETQIQKDKFENLHAEFKQLHNQLQ